MKLACLTAEAVKTRLIKVLKRHHSLSADPPPIFRDLDDYAQIQAYKLEIGISAPTLGRVGHDANCIAARLGRIQWAYDTGFQRQQ